MISMSLASASAASGSTPWKMPLRASTSSIAHLSVTHAYAAQSQSRHTKVTTGRAPI